MSSPDGELDCDLSLWILLEECLSLFGETAVISPVMSIDLITDSDLLFSRSSLLLLGLFISRLTLEVETILLVSWKEGEESSWLSSSTDTGGRGGDLEDSRLFSGGDKLESLVMGLAGRRVGVTGA